jgi:hypothetical protein
MGSTPTELMILCKFLMQFEVPGISLLKFTAYIYLFVNCPDLRNECSVDVQTSLWNWKTD